MRGIQVEFNPILSTIQLLIPVIGNHVPGTAAGAFSPLKGVARIIKFLNYTSNNIYVSTSPFNNNDNAELIVNAYGAGKANRSEFDFTTNETFNQGFFLPAQTIFYIGRVSNAGSSTDRFFIMSVSDNGSS